MESKKRQHLRTLFLTLILIFSSINNVVFSADKKFPQKIKWKTDPNALEYKVELRKIGGKSTFTKTTGSYMELSLPAGDYEYRVYVYDILGRESSVSAWKKFTILKAAEPEISVQEEKSRLEKSESDLSLDVAISSVTRESTVELVNVKTNEKVKGTLQIEKTSGKSGGETERATGITFPSVESGEWKIRITNPSGLSSESVPIRIVEPEPVIVAEEIQTEIPKEQKEEQKEEPNEPNEEIQPEIQQNETAEKTEAEQKQKPEPEKEIVIVEKFIEPEPKLDERQPKFIDNESEPTFLEDGRSFTLKVDADKVSEESVVELFDEKTGETVRGKITVRAVKVTFPETREGNWKLRITNTGGESDTARNIVAVGENPANREERIRAEEEARLRAEEEARRIAEEEEKRRIEEEKRRKKLEPYKCKDIFFMVGGGIGAKIYDGTLTDYDSSALDLTANAQIFYLAWKWKWQRLGFGLSSSYFTLDSGTSYYETNSRFITALANGIYQVAIVPEKEFIQATVKAGPSFLMRKISFSDNGYGNTQEDSSFFGYPTVGFGLSFFMIPMKFFTFEVGVDYTHVFMNGFKTGIIEPRIAIGLRL